jgi:hypothetical protein
LALYYPKSPEGGGKLTSRLTESNWKKASSIRFHKNGGFIRVYVVGHRYFDRVAGGFMGPGAYVYEGRVVCESYPTDSVGQSKVPEIKSAAGWGFSGTVQNVDGRALSFFDPKSKKKYVDSLAKEFWTVQEALTYANGEDGGRIAQETEPVRVTWTKSGYILRRDSA